MIWPKKKQIPTNKTDCSTEKKNRADFHLVNADTIEKTKNIEKHDKFEKKEIEILKEKILQKMKDPTTTKKAVQIIKNMINSKD